MKNKQKQATANKSKPKQAKASKSKPKQAKASQSKPKQAKASKSKPKQAKANQSKQQCESRPPTPPVNVTPHCTVPKGGGGGCTGRCRSSASADLKIYPNQVGLTNPNVHTARPAPVRKDESRSPGAGSPTKEWGGKGLWGSAGGGQGGNCGNWGELWAGGGSQGRDPRDRKTLPRHNSDRSCPRCGRVCLF
jgi:hypothetical protein